MGKRKENKTKGGGYSNRGWYNGIERRRRRMKGRLIDGRYGKKTKEWKNDRGGVGERIRKKVWGVERGMKGRGGGGVSAGIWKD